MKNSTLDQARQAMRRQIDDDLIAATFVFQAQNLPNIQITTGKEKEFREALDALRDYGCNPITLCWAIRLGKAAQSQTVGDIPRATTIKRLEKSVTAIADEIERLEKSGFMMMLNREEVMKLGLETEPEPGDIVEFSEELPHLNIQRWLRKKADMYRRWAKLASEHVPPKSGTMLRKLAYLYPALYVKLATRDIDKEALQELFVTIGIHTKKSQVRRELSQLCKDYKSTYRSMITMLDEVKDRTVC
jgi:hypothetical protein